MANKQAIGIFRLLNKDDIFAMKVLAEKQVLSFLVEFDAKIQESGLSKTDLAQKIGMDKSQFSRLLTGRRGLNAKTMFLMARGLGYRIEMKWIKVARKAELTVVPGTGSTHSTGQRQLFSPVRLVPAAVAVEQTDINQTAATASGAVSFHMSVRR